MKPIYETFTAPAGEYYLGDPCYCIDNHDIWMDCCKQWFETHDKINYVAKVKDSFILAFSTKHVDGLYKDQNGNEYPVNSGCIGLVPVHIADRNPREDLVKKIKFDKDTLCIMNDGVLTFGEYVIDTDSSYDDEEEYLYDEE